MTIIKGKVWKFGDDINTDIIIPFRFKSRTNDPVELAQYCMYGIDPEFPKKISKGDIIVAGKNFGGGSSREQAPVAIKYAGIGAVVAESFSRIFFRNSINIGLPILEIEGISKKVTGFDCSNKKVLIMTAKPCVEAGSELEIDLDARTVIIPKTGERLKAKEQLTGFMADILKSGGLVGYYRQNKKFPWE